MQNKDANETIKCILNLVSMINNNIIINVELSDKTFIYYRS